MPASYLSTPPYQTAEYFSHSSAHALAYSCIRTSSSRETALLSPSVVVPIQRADTVRAPMSTGGVVSTVDYDTVLMADYVSNAVVTLMYPGNELTLSPEFRHEFKTFTAHVLTATRLPKSTILLALLFLFKRWIVGNFPAGDPQIHITYKGLIGALLLANKFYDDNTFTNASWSEASQITVSELCFIERDWLRAVRWSLLPTSADDYHNWQTFKDFYEQFVSERSNRYPLSPVSPNPSIATPRYTPLLDPLPTILPGIDAIASRPRNPNYTQSQAIQPIRVNSFYVPENGTNICNCNICSFDSGRVF